uniref:transmembrane protein 94-like isoform X1 n=1 Tax=Styela clava TaxID=7725 RepID=UPI00193A78F5|nr:transmembrane protein 94-like isoform X1 [Styela clava]
MPVKHEVEFLTSDFALNEIGSELLQIFGHYQTSESIKKDVVNAFSLSSLLPWPYILLTLLGIAGLLSTITTVGSSEVCAFLLLSILILNIIVSLWETKKKRKEILFRTMWCCNSLSDVYKDSTTTDCLELNEFSSLLNNCDTSAISSSPSHSISCVYRKDVGNSETPLPIPTALLATGDFISLWPGQESPAKVECAQDECFVLECGEIFQLSHLQGCSVGTDDEDNPSSHRFRVLESPISAEFKKIFSSMNQESIKHETKPPILFERQRRYFLSWFLKFVIPALLVVAYIVSIVRLLVLPQPVNEVNLIISSKDFKLNISAVNDDTNSSWYNLLIEIPILLCIPLMPLLLPGLLILLTTIGEAKTLAVCQTTKPITLDQMVTTTNTLSSQAVFFKSKAAPKEKWQNLFSKLLLGKDGSLFHRNAGLFMPLGSLTILCCVDKEGILSWFNPIAEKVFFFKHEASNEAINDKSQNKDLQDIFKDSPEVNMLPVLRENDEEELNGSLFGKNDVTSPGSDEQKVTTETLTLSQDSRDPSHIQFDDVTWENQLSSLKPIGLNIVLSLCCCPIDQNNLQLKDANGSFQAEILEMLNQKDFLNDQRNKCSDNSSPHFRMHEQELSTIACNSDCLTPGNRIATKGLCSFAELIGFAQDVRLAYTCKQSFSAFKRPICALSQHHLAKLDISVSSQEHADLSLVGNIETLLKRNKWKQYLPHMHGVVLQDAFGDEHALVYGTGDLIAEQCKYIWDGKETRPNSVLDRKKAVDFYQRSSATGLCIAFAFMPVIPESLEDKKMDAENDNPVLINLSKTKEKKRSNIGPNHKEILSNMIFLGMTGLQHQARFTVCQMVDMLDRACIRFVYFSADNEVRSRAFAEKMGLETGWNCHISLSDSPNNTIVQEGRFTQIQNRSESSKSRSSSEGNSKQKQVQDDVEEDDSPSSHLLDRMSPRTQSESSASDSIFNVSNRAKLPRGIKNIVPHIENVDNVPLLVPLFTDATPETASEMLEIMQDYGEVVCCIGSSDCIRNMSVFHKAHVSLAIEPLVHPMKCSKSSSLSSSDSNSINSESYGYVSPDAQQLSISNCVAMRTARQLHCFPCSLLLSGDNSLNIISTMITQARHFLFLMRICFIFMMKCQIALSLFQLFTHTMLLPSPFLAMDVFWIAFVISPCLSLSLLGSPPDQDLMTWANQKTLPKDCPVTRFMLRQSTKRFLVKFLPSIFLLILCYTLCLQSCCLSVKDILSPDDSIQTPNSSELNIPAGDSSITMQCFPYFIITVTPNNSIESSTIVRISLWDSMADLQRKRRAIQLVVLSFFVLYLCIVSTSYVHRWKRLTQTSLYLNKLWCITVPILLLCQIVGGFVAYSVFNNKSSSNNKIFHQKLYNFSSSWLALDFGRYQIATWTLLAVWPVLCLGFNELWKSREINMWNRGQKRARLDFGTKLGMNSPF